jgi:hypothetical protein
MKSKPLPLPWMGAGFFVSLGLAATVLSRNGTGANGLVPALQLTARWSFLLFWIACAGGAIAALFGPLLAPLGRRGREFGLAYASAMTVHFSLVIWFFHISANPPLSGKIFDFFATGVVFTYLLAIFSIGRLAEVLGPNLWRILRITGVNYILFAFSWDFVPGAYRAATAHETGNLAWYLPFAAMCIAAPILVLAAAAQRRLSVRSSRAGLGPLVERAN